MKIFSFKAVEQLIKKGFRTSQLLKIQMIKLNFANNANNNANNNNNNNNNNDNNNNNNNNNNDNKK